MRGARRAGTCTTGAGCRAALRPYAHRGARRGAGVQRHVGRDVAGCRPGRARTSRPSRKPVSVPNGGRVARGVRVVDGDREAARPGRDGRGPGLVPGRPDLGAQARFRCCGAGAVPARPSAATSAPASRRPAVRRRGSPSRSAPSAVRTSTVRGDAVRVRSRRRRPARCPATRWRTAGPSPRRRQAVPPVDARVEAAGRAARSTAYGRSRAATSAGSAASTPVSSSPRPAPTSTRSARRGGPSASSTWHSSRATAAGEERRGVHGGTEMARRALAYEEAAAVRRSAPPRRRAVQRSLRRRPPCRPRVHGLDARRTSADVHVLHLGEYARRPRIGSSGLTPARTSPSLRWVTCSASTTSSAGTRPGSTASGLSSCSVISGLARRGRAARHRGRAAGPEEQVAAVPIVLALCLVVALRRRAPEKMLLLAAARRAWRSWSLTSSVDPGDFAMLVIIYTVAAPQRRAGPPGSRWRGAWSRPPSPQLRWPNESADARRGDPRRPSS